MDWFRSWKIHQQIMLIIKEKITWFDNRICVLFISVKSIEKIEIF